MKTKIKSLCAADLVYTQHHMPATVCVKDVVQFFRSYNGNYIAVTECDSIAGLVGWEKLLIRIGTPLGWSTYADQPISSVMDRNPLIVDGRADLIGLAQLAANRPIQTAYDDLIVSADSEYIGLVSIKLLMLAHSDLLQQQSRTIQQQQFLLEKNITNHLLDQRTDQTLMTRKTNAILQIACKLEMKSEQEAACISPEEMYDSEPLHGYLKDFSAIDLMQLLVQYGKTGQLDLCAGPKEDSQRFEVYLQHGMIFHALGAGDSGTEALWKALRLQQGEFVFHFHRIPHVRTIEGNPMRLLLEACHKQDREPSSTPA